MSSRVGIWMWEPIAGVWRWVKYCEPAQVEAWMESIQSKDRQHVYKPAVRRPRNAPV